MKSILETRELSKNYKQLKANDKISLKLYQGSIYGLLGPNGAGKSTFLKMITGMLKPSAGEIYFEGKELKRSDLAYIGSLIESAPIYENLTARENLKVRTLMFGLPDSRIDEVLQIVSLTDTGRKRAGQFSMGMKQRLGIAIALLNHPRLLILDEPTNGLDPIGINDLRHLIRSFAEQGLAIIISSHILSEIEQTADHIGIIVNGKLCYQGEISKTKNLEALFMEIVRKERDSND